LHCNTQNERQTSYAFPAFKSLHNHCRRYNERAFRQSALA